MIYLNCGIESVFTPELMAQQLREQARMLFSQMGVKAIKVLVNTLKPASNLVGLLTTFLDTAIPTAELLNACESEFFPDTSKDLTAVIKTYNLILNNTPFWKKDPIIVISALLRKIKVTDFTFNNNPSPKCSIQTPSFTFSLYFTLQMNLMS
jgi:hypothetical protein